jgi:hypothetical protein
LYRYNQVELLVAERPSELEMRESVGGRGVTIVHIIA